METKPEAARVRGMSEFTWRHLVRTYGEEFAEICVLPEAEYWRVISERMQNQNTERDLINEIVPSEWAPTLAAARHCAASRGEGNGAE
jgi:hypothetical protein